MAALAEMAATGAQFIIATHNPILLSFPGAAIYSFDRAPVVRMDWEDLEQVSLMRDFLTQPGLYLRHLGLADIGPS
jgi:predicted ATPase